MLDDILKPQNSGQETKHVKIGHVKIDRAHFRVREHWAISCEHSRGSLPGDLVVRFTQTSSTFVGISVDIFAYTPVCIFMSTFVREFVGQISRFACSVLF